MEQPRQIDTHIENEEEDIGRDWLKISRNVKNDGLRTGIDASQEQALQLGFNAGFRDALQMSLAGGQLHGVICAQLRSTASNVTVESSVQGQAANILVCDQLQKLLSSNAQLVSSIPSLLQRKAAWKQPAAASLQHHHSHGKSSDLSLVKTDVKHLEIFCAARESGQSTTREHAPGTSVSQESEKAELSCEHVCSSQSHFWIQLQLFKMEAQTYGVD